MRWTARDVRSLGVGLAYLAPALFIFVVFVFIPLGRTFYLSFYNTRSTGVISTFNGIDHYIDLVTSATFRSSLQGVAEEIYEAARLDGARGARMFTRITVPLVSPSLFFLLVVDTVAVLQAFTQIHLLTRGGPVDATRTLVYSIYLDAFQNFQFGFASAESVVLFVLIMGLTIIQFRFVERLVHYQ